MSESQRNSIHVLFVESQNGIKYSRLGQKQRHETSAPILRLIGLLALVSQLSDTQLHNTAKQATHHSYITKLHYTTLAPSCCEAAFS